jgi:hypothetical protein
MDWLKLHRSVPSLVLIANLCCGEAALAQGQPPVTAGGPAAPLTLEETRAVQQTALSDARVQAIIGAGQARVFISSGEIDKAEAEAFISGTSTTPPVRPIVVVVFNISTNKAARVLVLPAQNRVLAVRSLPASDVPFGRDDADQALALAKAHPDVRRAIGETLDRFEILDPGSEARIAYAAQALPLRSTNPHDACRVHRCLDLIFRTENGYLPFRVHVDLTKRTVTVSRQGQHR